MPKLTIDYEKALEDFGEPKGGEILSEDELNSYRGHIPNSLLDFWEIYGVGIWLDGYFQFCSPQKYRPILELILQGDKEFFAERSHLIGFSAFGELLVWNEDYRVVEIDVINHHITCRAYVTPLSEEQRRKITEDISLGIAVLYVDEDTYDLPDQDGKPMFKRALKMLGPVDFGEIYALKLHPALGGPITVENLGRKDALVAMSIAAQTGPFQLLDTSTPRMKIIREI